MKRVKNLVPFSLIMLLILTTISCGLMDLPKNLIGRFIPQSEKIEVRTTDNAAFLPGVTKSPEPTATNSAEPSSTYTIEPTLTTVPTQIEISPQNTFMHRVNLERTGVYPSPGPKESPSLLWKFEAGDSIYSEPVVYEGVIYFGCHDGKLYAVDIETAELLWDFETEDTVLSPPAISEGVIYFGSDDGNVYALDLETGYEIWKFKTGDWVSSSPTISDSMVIVGSYDGYLYALDSLNGTEIWKFEVSGINNSAEGLKKGVGSSPAISGGVVLFGSAQIGGASRELFFYGLDLMTGEMLWEFSTWNVITSPVVYEGIVYFGTQGSFYGLNIKDGSLILDFDTGIVTTEPAVYEGVVFFGTQDGLVFAVDLEIGEEKWVFDAGSYINNAPSISDGVVYFGLSNGLFYALNSENGQILWEYDTNERISTSPIIVNGSIFFGTDEGYLFTLN